MAVVLDPDLEKHLLQANILAHPPTAFRLMVKAASNASTDRVVLEWLWRAWRDWRQVVKQLQDDEDTLEKVRRSGGELASKNAFGDGSSAFVRGGNGKFDGWPSNHGENEFSCGTDPKDLGRDIIVDWSFWNTRLLSSFWGIAVQGNEGSKNSLLLEGRPISQVSSKASLRSDGEVFAEDDLWLLPSAEPDEIDQFVSKVNTGLFFLSEAMDIAWESNTKGECKASAMLISWLAILTLMLELLIRLSALGLPTLNDGLYLQYVPQVRQREHIGLVLLHLTFAKKHPSHEALNLWRRGLFEALLDGIVAGIRLRVPEM